MRKFAQLDWFAFAFVYANALSSVGTFIAHPGPLVFYNGHTPIPEKENIMKSLLLLVALLFAVTLSSSSSVTSKAAPAKKQKAVMTFAEPVKLQGVMLKGEYLFVHDDAAMANGEACTFVYKGTVETASKLVVKFHCTRLQRAKAGSFTVRTNDVAGVSMLTEFQFSGETEAHGIPAN